MHETEELVRVLLVEDVEPIRKGLLLATPWMELGCVVVGDTGNGLEALRLYEKFHPDIVITDIRMPGMDGLTFIQKARSLSPCEFLIVTAYRDFNYAQTVIQNAGRAYLLKPVDTEELHKVLRETVQIIRNRWRQERILTQVNNGRSSEYLRMIELLSGVRQSSRHLAMALQIMTERLGEPLTARMVADQMQISESYLTKLFKNGTQYTFLEVLTVLRIQRAVELLNETDLRVYEVASAVGYQDNRYFSMVFQRYTGISPSQYRSGM